MVGLDPDLSRRVGQYSQGMRQRLSLARAVLHDPELMLLDEPFSNVDVHSARDMAAILGRVRDQGKTIFVVTHQAALWRMLPTSLYTCRRDRSSPAERLAAVAGRPPVRASS